MSFAAVSITAVFIIVSFFSCTTQTPKANLRTDIDSLSYAYGINITQGLDEYLQGIGIDESVKKEFIKGFLEGSKLNKNDKKAIAHIEGITIGRQVAIDMFSRIDRNVFGADSTKMLSKKQFLAGFIAATEKKKLLFTRDDASAFVQAKSDEIRNKANEQLKTANVAFLESNKTKEGVITLPSGLQYKVEKDSKGPKPAAEDTVIVKYKGTDIEGNVFDSNDKLSIPLNRVVPGWTEGMQLMSVGSKYTFYIPYNLGYGEKGSQPNIKPYATLVFDVELLGISAKK